MLKGFKNFLMRGDVIVVAGKGLRYTAVVALTLGWIT